MRHDERPNVPSTDNLESRNTQQPSAEELYDTFQSYIRERDGGKQNGAVTELLEAVAPIRNSLPQMLDGLSVLKAWLDSFRPLPASIVEELRKFYTVSLTYHSNAIEGNTLTQSETEMVLSQGVTVGGKTLVEHLEVVGHRDAMSYMEELAGRTSPLDEREIKDLHSLIMRPVDQATGNSEAGRYRTLDVRAAGTDYVYPAHFHLPDLMREFVAWLGSEGAQALHPVEYASQAHFRFVSIHPFRDGNGRTGRLLMNLCLMRAGYPITVITNAHRAAYINALVYGQSHHDDATRLTQLVAQECRTSFIEYLRLLATAGESRGRGDLFYGDLLEVK